MVSAVQRFSEGTTIDWFRIQFLIAGSLTDHIYRCKTLIIMRSFSLSVKHLSWDCRISETCLNKTLSIFFSCKHQSRFLDDFQVVSARCVLICTKTADKNTNASSKLMKKFKMEILLNGDKLLKDVV